MGKVAEEVRGPEEGGEMAAFQMRARPAAAGKHSIIYARYNASAGTMASVVDQAIAGQKETLYSHLYC